MIKMLCLCGNFVTNETVSSAINIIISTQDLIIYSIHKLFLAISNNIEEEGLVKLGLYVFGEYSECLLSSTVRGPSDEIITVSEKDLILLLGKINQTKYNNVSSVKEYLLNCLVKLSVKLSNTLMIKEVFEAESRSYYFEVQQRAVEYKILNEKKESNIKLSMFQPMPLSKLTKEDENKYF